MKNGYLVLVKFSNFFVEKVHPGAGFRDPFSI